jgi:alpha-L-fucosidase 2
MKKLIYFFALILLASCAPVKIACVGDSITEGSGIKWQSKSAYPVVLGNLLGDKYQVLNCGRSSATLQKNGDLPYWCCNEFSNVFVFRPDVITIKLGTNDTKPQNWKLGDYEADYQALVDTFKTISPKIKIILIKPVPVYKSRWGINDSTLTKGVFPVIDRIASKNKLQVIDLYQPMLQSGGDFPDDIHPNAKAAKKMAEIIAGKLKGK